MKSATISVVMLAACMAEPPPRHGTGAVDTTTLEAEPPSSTVKGAGSGNARCDTCGDGDGGDAWTPESMAQYTQDYGTSLYPTTTVDQLDCIRGTIAYREGVSCLFTGNIPLLGEIRVACSWYLSNGWHLDHCDYVICPGGCAP